MCFVLVAFKVKPEVPLLIAANRDEFYARAAVSAHWWPRGNPILAGRDETGGGTWFGVRRDGRFAVVTNRRAPAEPRGGRVSRGALPLRVLDHEGSPAALHASLDADAGDFNPYNLLHGGPDSLFYFDNHRRVARELAPGVYALSNAYLDTPWPKVESGRGRFAALVESGTADDEALFALLADDAVYDDARLPDTGVGAARERALSAIFIRDGDYGTRCSTLFRLERDGRARFAERNFAGLRRGRDESVFEFRTIGHPSATAPE